MPTKTYDSYRSPAGVAFYPWLTEPDTKFDKDGVYHCTLHFDANEDTALFIDYLHDLRDAFFDDLDPKQKKTFSKVDCFEPVLDDTGEETGKLAINFKLKAIVRPKDKEAFEQQPRLFDASTPPKLITDVKPWSGSVLKIAGDVVPYAMASTKNCGVSLRMKAVQILELVEGSGTDASAFGFEGSEDGFHAAMSEAPENPFGNAGAGDF